MWISQHHAREMLSDKSFATYMRALPFESDVEVLIEDHRGLHTKFSELTKQQARAIGGWTAQQIKMAHDRVVERILQLDATFEHDSPILLPGQGPQRQALQSSTEHLRTMNTLNTYPKLTSDERQALKHCAPCQQKQRQKESAMRMSKSQALEAVRAMTWKDLVRVRPDVSHYRYALENEETAALDTTEAPLPEEAARTPEPIPPGMMDEDTLAAAFGQILNLDVTDPLLEDIVDAVINILEGAQAETIVEVEDEEPVEEVAEEALRPLSSRMMNLVGGRDINRSHTVLESELSRARLPQTFESSIRQRFSGRRYSRESLRRAIRAYQAMTNDLIHTTDSTVRHGSDTHQIRESTNATERAFLRKVGELMGAK